MIWMYVCVWPDAHGFGLSKSKVQWVGCCLSREFNVSAASMGLATLLLLLLLLFSCWTCVQTESNWCNIWSPWSSLILLATTKWEIGDDYGWTCKFVQVSVRGTTLGRHNFPFEKSILYVEYQHNALFSVQEDLRKKTYTTGETNILRELYTLLGK